MSTTIETDTCIAPAHYASYAVNGDPSSLNDAEIASANEWLTDLAEEGWRVVSCGEAYYDSVLIGSGWFDGEVTEYTLLRTVMK